MVLSGCHVLMGRGFRSSRLRPLGTDIELISTGVKETEGSFWVGGENRGSVDLISFSRGRGVGNVGTDTDSGRSPDGQ